MASAQQRTTARLLRRALEAALPPPSHKPASGRRLLDTVADRIAGALPPPREASLVLRETEAEREANFGRRPRSFEPWIRRFEPYEELFVYRRVVRRPWDEVWRTTPLILHDVDLLHAFRFPPYLEAEPHDQVENITKILENHPGPVESLRVDCSLFPQPQQLACWMDLLSARGIRELVMIDVAAPPSPQRAVVDFPVSRLRSACLATLALGFVSVTLGWCWGMSGLRSLSLVCCRCSARDLSLAIQNLENLNTLHIFGVDLAPAGAGAGAARDGVLEISSGSLLHLELSEARACGLTLRHASSLKSLVAGVVSPEVKNPRVRWPTMASASPPLMARISFLSAQGLETISSLMLWRQTISLSSGSAPEVQTMEASLHVGVPEQWRQVLNLAANLPLLRCRPINLLWSCVCLQRMDDCRADEEEEEEEAVELQPLPNCFRDSLRQLHIHGYRAGRAEMSLVTAVLACAAQLECVMLYPHQTFADHPFVGCPRLSPNARVQRCQTLPF